VSAAFSIRDVEDTVQQWQRLASSPSCRGPKADVEYNAKLQNRVIAYESLNHELIENNQRLANDLNKRATELQEIKSVRYNPNVEVVREERDLLAKQVLKYQKALSKQRVEMDSKLQIVEQSLKLGDEQSALRQEATTLETEKQAKIIQRQQTGLTEAQAELARARDEKLMLQKQLAECRKKGVLDARAGSLNDQAVQEAQRREETLQRELATATAEVQRMRVIVNEAQLVIEKQRQYKQRCEEAVEEAREELRDEQAQALLLKGSVHELQGCVKTEARRAQKFAEHADQVRQEGREACARLEARCAEQAHLIGKTTAALEAERERRHRLESGARGAQDARAAAQGHAEAATAALERQRTELLAEASLRDQREGEREAERRTETAQVRKAEAELGACQRENVRLQLRVEEAERAGEAAEAKAAADGEAAMAAAAQQQAAERAAAERVLKAQTAHALTAQERQREEAEQAAEGQEQRHAAAQMALEAQLQEAKAAAAAATAEAHDARTAAAVAASKAEASVEAEAVGRLQSVAAVEAAEGRAEAAAARAAREAEKLVKEAKRDADQRVEQAVRESEEAVNGARQTAEEERAAADQERKAAITKLRQGAAADARALQERLAPMLQVRATADSRPPPAAQ
jgi:hypothetical protein